MAESVGLFGKLKTGLMDSVKRVFSGHGGIDEKVFEDLEATLIQADLGVETSLNIVEEMRKVAREQKIEEPEELIETLKNSLTKIMEAGDHGVSWHAANSPHVTLIAGVNGTGKTTSVGKLAYHLTAQGKSVLLGAADTFRAAAVEQLTIWSERADVPIVKHQAGADPAAVAFDATDSALSRNVDCLLIDTAGRLHTKVNLMEELRKIHRVIAKRIPDAPHEVLLVLDATTGQNGLQQAKHFTEALNVTGVILTKLDGTAKGGIAVAIQQQLGIPIKYIGVGEGINDLHVFDPRAFVEALLAE